LTVGVSPPCDAAYDERRARHGDAGRRAHRALRPARPAEGRAAALHRAGAPRLLQGGRGRGGPARGHARLGIPGPRGHRPCNGRPPGGAREAGPGVARAPGGAAPEAPLREAAGALETPRGRDRQLGPARPRPHRHRAPPPARGRP
jgi:hypothetical protein